LATSIGELKPLVEISHASQEEIGAFRERYDRLGQDAPLPPKSLRELRDGRRRFLNLQSRLANIVKRYLPLAASGVASEDDSVLRFQGLSVSLLAAVTVYDNYLSLLTVLKDDRLRRLLNHPDYGFGIEEGALRNIVDRLNSPEVRIDLRRLLDAWTEMNETGDAMDETSVLLRNAIESSVSYRYASEASLAEQLPSEWHLRRTRFMDALDGMAGETLGAISKAFGNGIGLVEMRKGKLFGNQGVHRHLLGVLKPLDLLLEKTPFRLTDYLIPGHFGHVAIWMGNNRELDSLGLWAQPEMQEEPFNRYPEQIRRSHSVLEALRTGVELNTLGHFLNVDDVAVLRPKSLSDSQVVESLIRGFRQVGKEYDFNFDVETTGSIVCSELPYHVYPGVAWQTGSQLGRFTISPDQVASQALTDSGAFELIVFYHDGELVNSNVALALMEALMRDS
jgi:hypothetical protein